MEKVILTIQSEEMSNDLHVGFHGMVKPLFTTTYNAEDLELVEYVNPYVAALDDEIEAHRTPRGSEKTADVIARDNKRDGTWRSIGQVVNVATKHFDENVRAAAESVKFLMKTYGNVPEKQLDAETSDIDDFLGQARSEKYAPMVALLGLETWLTMLEADNAALKSAMQTRDAENAAKPASTGSTRKVTDKTFNSLLNHLNALVEVKGIAKYEALIRDLNAITVRFRNELAQRQGARKVGTAAQPAAPEAAQDKA